MASIHREITLAVPAAQAWDAMRDAGALHTRLVKGFVTDCRMEDGVRTVTFGNGLVVSEMIVDIEDARRRIAWAIHNERLAHYNASTQIFEEGPRACRVLWTADLLPHAMAAPTAAMIEHGLAAMKSTLEGTMAA